MIISASRRTDIPCYFSEWFMNRIRAGFVLTRNPMNHAQLSKIPLSPEIVDCIVFWTKDAANILPHLDALDRLGYNYYFQFTLTPYDRTLEWNLRPKTVIEDTFIDLSKRVGAERVVWRYDPIILNDDLTIDYHKMEFRRMCDKLSPYTDTVTVSFVDMYPKLEKRSNTNRALIRTITADEMAELSEFISLTVKGYGLRAVACCEQNDLTQHGIKRSSCIDKDRVEKVCGCLLDIKTDKNQRPGCGCYESIDIGAYNTCLNGCIYCYANDYPATTKNRHDSHDPNSELLIGNAADGGKTTVKSVKSNKKKQVDLF